MGKSDNSDIHIFTKKGKYIRSLLKYGKGLEKLQIFNQCVIMNTIRQLMFYVIASSGGKLICNIFGNEKLESDDSYLLLMNVK